MHTPEGRLVILAADLRELLLHSQAGGPHAQSMPEAAAPGLPDSELRGIEEAVARPAGGKAGLDALCSELLVIVEAASRLGPGRLHALRAGPIAALVEELGAPLPLAPSSGDAAALRFRQLSVAALPALACAVAEAITSQVSRASSRVRLGPFTSRCLLCHRHPS